MTEIEAAEMANELAAHTDAIARLAMYPTTNATALTFHRGEALVILSALGAFLNV